MLIDLSYDLGSIINGIFSATCRSPPEFEIIYPGFCNTLAYAQMDPVDDTTSLARAAKSYFYFTGGIGRLWNRTLDPVYKDVLRQKNEHIWESRSIYIFRGFARV